MHRSLYKCIALLCIKVFLVILCCTYLLKFREGFNTLSKSNYQSTHIEGKCTTQEVGTLSRNFLVPKVNCAKVFRGDKEEIEFAVNLTKSAKYSMLSDKLYMNITQDCEEFKRKRGYITCPVSLEEENFPIAFSLLVYKDIEMVERLLRAIYRPQNYYCIHVDNNSNLEVFNAALAISNCFENVFISSKRIKVSWGKFSVLEPELICMEQLWKYKKWKYFINLTGQEFPLKTNFELVQILKAYNGANDIDDSINEKFNYRWEKNPAPHNITPVKGGVHILGNRDYVDYILHNQTAKDLLEWVKKTYIPDETFFATLNYNPHLGIKGTYNGLPGKQLDTSREKPFLTRFKNWGYLDWPCSRHYHKNICILSTGDLPLLGQIKHLFGNKFFLWEDSIVIGCLEEMIFNKTRAEIMGYSSFNTTYYSQLGFVLNQVK